MYMKFLAEKAVHSLFLVYFLLIQSSSHSRHRTAVGGASGNGGRVRIAPRSTWNNAPIVGAR
jgi:hypothetical protein